MSRVLLVSANTAVDPYPVYPLGMAMVAGALAAHGHEVRQFDLLAAGPEAERMGAEIRSFAPEVVGLSLRNIDDVSSLSGESAWYLEGARRLAAAVREATPAPLIVGGAGFTLMPEAILDFLGADHGVAGEGERLACELVDALAAGRPVPRVLRNGGPGLEGSAFAPPRVERPGLDFYLGETGIANLQTKRGCPYRCAYCTYPLLEGRKLRTREPRAVAEDLLRLKGEGGVESVFFTDSVFNDVGGHHLALAEELIRREVGMRWAAIFRPQHTGRTELALLKRAGLHAMELGTDALAEATLEALEKGFTVADVMAFHAAVRAEGIPAAHFVIFGGPGETTATVEESLGNVRRLEKAVVFAFSGVRILPGTGIHQRALREGVIEAGASLLRPVYYFSPRVVPAEMNARLEEAFRKRREWVFPPSEGRVRMEIMRRFGFRGLLWKNLVTFSR